MFSRHVPPTAPAFSWIVKLSIPARRSFTPMHSPDIPAPTIATLGLRPT